MIVISIFPIVQPFGNRPTAIRRRSAAVGVLPLGVRGREEFTDVAKRRCAKYRVDEGVQGGVGVRMPSQPAIRSELHASHHRGADSPRSGECRSQFRRALMGLPARSVKQ